MQDVIISPFWTFYSDNYLSTASLGKGYTGVGSLGDISITSLNPASLNLDKKFQIQVQYTYKTSQPWLPEVENDISLKQNLFSISAAFGYRINKSFQTGFLYSNPQSLYMHLGNIIVTDTYGNETGTYEGYGKYIIHSFSVPFVYSTDEFRFGVTANYSLYTNISAMPADYVVTGTMDKFNIQFGMMVTPSEQFSVGATFVPGFTGNVDYTDGVSQNQSTMPMRFGLGVEYTFKKSSMKISADYDYSNTSVIQEFRDQHQFHLGIEYPINRTWTVRAGAFNTEDPRNLSQGIWVNSNDNLNQVCLTAGATCKLNKLEASIAIMDSHVSPGTIKNTYINGGLTYNFK